jgi:hypothetical protein
MRRALFVLGILALLATPTLAADEQQQLSLTVYNSNLALVEDVRHLDLPAGRSRVEFKDVSASIRPETVTLTGSGLGIVEQNFDYDLLTPAKMMEKMVGKQIKIVRTIPGTGKEITETATVLSVNDGVILKIGDRIEALRDDGIPTRVIFTSIPENLRATPTLSVTVDAASAGARNVTLSYLTAGLSWKADYIALFDEADNNLHLQGWVTLTNKSGTSFNDARAQVVAGVINIVSTESEYWQREQNLHQSSNRAAGSGPGNQESVADYLVYALPEKVTVADSQTKQVGFVDLHSVKATKDYAYNANDFSSDSNPQHADSVLKFSNVGKALPAGIVRAYMRDAAGDAKFVGENYLDHAPAGSDIAIKIGQAFDVTAQATLVSSEPISKTRSRYSMSYSFHNAEDKPITVEFRQAGLWQDGKVENESLPGKRIDAHTLGWSIPVAASGETTLTFAVDTGG